MFFQDKITCIFFFIYWFEFHGSFILMFVNFIFVVLYRYYLDVFIDRLILEIWGNRIWKAKVFKMIKNLWFWIIIKDEKDTLSTWLLPLRLKWCNLGGDTNSEYSCSESDVGNGNKSSSNSARQSRASGNITAIKFLLVSFLTLSTHEFTSGRRATSWDMPEE